MLLVVTSATFAQEKPTVVIVPFDSVGIDKEELNVLFEVFTSEFAGLGFARVVDRNSFDKIRAQHSFQESDWSDSDKIAQLGKALNANMIVTGQLLLFRGKLIATFRMMDVNTVEIVATTTEQVSDTNELLDKLKEIAKNLSINMNSNFSSITQSEIEIKLSNDVAKDKNTSNNQKYNIGDDGPGGGIVFYYSEKGFAVYQADGSIERCNYLEVSKTKVANVSWCSMENLIDGCCYINTKTELGFGKMNTYKIINGKHSEGTVSSSNCAAKACFEYSTAQTAKGEWFLPSKDELNLLYKNLGKINLATATEESLWSSSQTSKQASCCQVFSSGNQYDYQFKAFTNSVRAIRAF